MLKTKISSGAYDNELKRVYVSDDGVLQQRERYVKLINFFEEEFGENNSLSFYSAPGRTEVCGNHTDHNNGKVLAAAVNLDAVAVCAKKDGNITRVKSVGYDMDAVDITDMNVHKDAYGTSCELIRGMYAGFIERGYNVGAFDAYTTSSVLSGSGLSSSAAFEVLIGTILNYMFNDGKISPVEIAQIAQFSENKYFGKPCGLMDQMASSVGGFVKIDFKDTKEPVITKLDFDFASCGHALCIVNTGGSHADLTPEYGAVRSEMESAAAVFGKNVLREVCPEEFKKNIALVREKAGDRAYLRALHFVTENIRVQNAVAALRADDFDGFLKMIKASGDSSYKYLQNVYTNQDVQHQNVSVALAVSDAILGSNGVCRVHGGGFAGTIQAFVKNEALKEYKETLDKVFGKDACAVLKIRKYGGMKVL